MNSSIINFHKNNKQGRNIASFDKSQTNELTHDDIFSHLDTVETTEYVLKIDKHTEEYLDPHSAILLQNNDINNDMEKFVVCDSLPHFFHDGKCLVSLSDLFELELLKYDDVFTDQSDLDVTDSDYPFQMGWKDRDTITIIESKNKTPEQIYFDQRSRVIESVIESHKNSMSDKEITVANDFVKYVLRKSDLPQLINFYSEKNADLLFVSFAITLPDSWYKEQPIQEEEFEYCLSFPGRCDFEECRICNRIMFLIKFTSSKTTKDAILVTKLYITMLRDSLKQQNNDSQGRQIPDVEEDSDDIESDNDTTEFS